MLCVGCEQKVKGTQAAGARCRNCGHAFVADPPTEVFTDVAIRKALERVTASETASFLPEHLGYELLRRIATRRRRGRWWMVVAAIVILVGIVGARMMGWSAPLLVSLVGAFMLWGNARHYARDPDVFALAARYLSVNPSARSVASGAALSNAQRGEAASGLGAAKQVLVCQHRRHCDFLIANAFHLLAACPVVGPDGYLADLYPGLADRLARGPAIGAFVLHDYTPAGLAFASRVAHMPPWLGRRDTATIVDVGLSPAHRPVLERSLRPITSIPGSAHGLLTLPNDRGAEVTAVRPASMLAALARSLETRKPLALGRSRGDSSAGGDSE